MKLSFSLSANPQNPKNKPNKTFIDSKPDDASQPSHEYVTEFDPAQPKKTKSQIIPPLPNNDDWRRRPCKKMKNIELPLSEKPGPGGLMDFEVAAEEGDHGSSKISYGLNIRKTEEERDGRSVEKLLLEKLREDMDRLPEANGLEDFEEVPVEGFGKALLSGYGWKEGMGIGKNAKGDVKVVEYSRRGNREGLGFDSKVEKGRLERKGSGEQEREPDVVRGDEHYLVGKDVRVVEGRDVGLKGRVVDVSGDDKVVLKVSKNGEEVRVRIGKVAEIGSKEEAKCIKRLKEVKDSGRDERRDVGKRGDERKSDLPKKVSSGSRNSNSNMWLRNHIRVKVISKELKRGRLYLKKARIVDVVGPAVCDITMDESGELVQGVNQDLLQTALPARGGPVLVLFGKHKGVYGSLVEKDLAKETAVVQDADSHEMLDVHLDQIAEYIGDPSYIGY